MGFPKVSVIIPAYNHEQFVGEAIRSVLEQTLQDFELIIINDGSSDQTETKILQFKDDRIRYFSQMNRGLSATLNRGIELARGDYFNFLPSDDSFHPQKLEIQVRTFEGKPDLGLVFSYPELIDAEGRPIHDEFVTQWPIVPYETKEEIFPALFERNFLSAPTALIKMDCVRKVGLFDVSLKYAQDYDMWMRILKHYDIRLLKQPLVRYRWHGKNLTYQATPETELERAKVLLKAYKNLAIEEIFPSLRQRGEASAYAGAYRRLAGYMGKSGIPALFPVSRLYEDEGVLLQPSGVSLAETRGATMEKGGEVKIQGHTSKQIHVLMEALSLGKGGLEQVIFNLAKGLDRDLFKVVLVGVERGGIFAQRAKEIGIPVEILMYDKTREYQEILDRYQIDIVVSHYCTFGARLAFEKGIPTLSVVHNIYSWFPDNVLSEFKSADPFVSRYIAVSGDVKRYAQYRFNIPSEKIVVIPNGIDIEEFADRSSSKALTRSDLGLEEDDYVFINVASVGPPKGQNVIVAALRQIVEKHPQIKVLSVGEVYDDGFLKFLKEEIEKFHLSNHFKFIGLVDDVKPYLQVADAFLLTSYIEGWPLSVMEAMLMQLPVLMTRVGGAEAILGESGAGIILKNNYEDVQDLDVPSLDNLSREESPRNAREVAEAMVRFFVEKDHWKRAGSRGYKRISKFFHLQGMIRSYERELINLFSASVKSKEQHLSGKVSMTEKLLDAKEHLLQEREKAVEIFRSQETYHRDTLGSKLGLLESKGDAQNETLRKQVEDVSVRLKEITESKFSLLESKRDAQNEALRKQVEDVSARFKEITEPRLNLLESKVGLVESKVDFRSEDVKKRVEDLSVQVKEMAESNLNSLQSKLTLLENRTETQTEVLRRHVEDLSVRFKEIAESKLSLLESKTDAQNEALRRQVEELAGRLRETAESNLAALQSRLALVETKVDTQNEALRKQVEDLSVRFKEMTESNLTPLRTQLTLIESKAEAQNEAFRRQGEELALRLKEMAESNLNLLGSKLDFLKSSADLQYEDMRNRVEFVLLRLSLKERVKTDIYRLMKRIHLLVPVSIREKYHARYREIFFNKVIPSDKKAFENKVFRPRKIQTPKVQEVAGEQEPERTESPGVREVVAIREPERVDPVQSFRRFKEEIVKGLSLELEKFRAPCFPNLVSVVLPVYNQAYLLGNAIESVLSQTYPSMELIVVNDGSTDAIESVIERYRENPKITIVNQKNQKLPGALTNGFKQARGEFYTWTSADNMMYPKQLETQVEFFKNRPGTQMVYANYDIIDDQGRPLLGSDYCPGYQIPFGSNHIHLPQDPSELCVVRNNYIGPCFMYRSWVGRLIGDYDRFTFTMEDYDYWMIINDLFKTEHLGKADILYANRVHADSLTGRKKELRIVENTDRLMEFEKGRQEFYRQKFKIYLIGNHDRLAEIKRLYEASGNSVTQFRIPCENIEMEKEKAIGIWIYSSLERGLMARICEANPHAFFVMIHLVSEDIPEGDLEGKLDMVVSLVAKGLEHFQDRRWFFSERIEYALYPILCKANVDLFRRTNRFQILW